MPSGLFYAQIIKVRERERHRTSERERTGGGTTRASRRVRVTKMSS